MEARAASIEAALGMETKSSLAFEQPSSETSGQVIVSVADGLQMSLFSGTARPNALAQLPALGRRREGVWSQGHPADSSHLLRRWGQGGGCKVWKPACWGGTFMFHTGRKVAVSPFSSISQQPQLLPH